MADQINPSKIDSNYTVLGVLGDIKGFRSNFTKPKIDFQYAAAKDSFTLDNSFISVINVVYACAESVT